MAVGANFHQAATYLLEFDMTSDCVLAPAAKLELLEHVILQLDRHCDLRMLKVLVEHGFDLNSRNNLGQTALHVLANGFARMTFFAPVSVRISTDTYPRETKPRPWEPREGRDQHPIDPEGDLVVNQKCVVEVQGLDGETHHLFVTLEPSFYFGHRFPAVKYLVERGADLSIVDNRGNPALPEYTIEHRIVKDGYRQVLSCTVYLRSIVDSRDLGRPDIWLEGTRICMLLSRDAKYEG